MGERDETQNTAKTFNTKWPVLIIVMAVILLLGLAKHALNKPVAEPSELVSDPEVLSYIWDEYIEDTISTIANQPFANPEQIDRSYAIQYAIRLMCRKGMYENLTDELGRIEAKEVSELIEQYLNTSITDINPQDFAYTAFYDKDNNGFYFNEITSSNVKYNEENPWGIKLDSVYKNEAENSYTVKLLHYVSHQSSRITKETIYTLQERQDGTMCFVSIINSYPDSEELVVIDGEFQKLDLARLKIKPSDKEWPCHVLGDYDGKLFVRFDNGKEGCEYEDVLKIYDDQNFNELGRFSSSKQFLTVKVKQSGYLILNGDKILQLDHSLNLAREIDVPSIVAKEVFQGDWWGGLDISIDGRYFIYSSQSQGLMLYDSETESEKVLAKHLPENQKLYYVPYIYDPSFVDSDRKAAAKIMGYECIDGHIMTDLETGEVKKLSIDTYGYNNIYTFNGDLSAAYGVSSFTANHEGKPDIYLNRLDYEKMKISTSKATLSDDSQSCTLSPEIWPAIAQNDRYLAYVTVQYANSGDHADDMYYIVRIDLNTMKAETLLSIKAGYPTVLGMLEDGRVLFSYYFENARGMGITPHS